MAIDAIKPPRDNEPVSPIKIIAGGALNHKKPKPEPNNAAQMITISPTFGTVSYTHLRAHET